MNKRIIVLLISICLCFISINFSISFFNKSNNYVLSTQNDMQQATLVLKAIVENYYTRFLVLHQFSANTDDLATLLKQNDIHDTFKKVVNNNPHIISFRIYNLFGYVVFSMNDSELGSMESSRELRNAIGGDRSTSIKNLEKVTTTIEYIPVYLKEDVISVLEISFITVTIYHELFYISVVSSLIFLFLSIFLLGKVLELIWGKNISLEMLRNEEENNRMENLVNNMKEKLLNRRKN